MITVARTAVPAALAGLLLTACGGGKSGPTTLATGSAGGNPIAVAPTVAPNRAEPMKPGTNWLGTSTAVPNSAGSPMGAVAGMDSVASGGMAASLRAAMPVAAAPSVAAAPADAHTIAVRGVGKASGTPDTLTVVIGVSTQDASAKAALEANNAKAAALIALLRKNGVDPKDLQTRQLSINPTYNDKSATISGYQVDNVVQVRLHDIAGAGTLLDAAAGAVGNAVRVQQIGFSVGDDSAVRAQARAQAVNQAKAQAAEIAKAAGVTLGRIRSITEVGDAGYPVSYDMSPAAGAASSVPLQPGQQELTVAVDLVYEMS